MARTAEETLSLERLTELATRADKIGRDVFSPFLTPPEAELAKAAARKANVPVSLFGGYDDAERVMARFGFDESEYPFCALELTWPLSEAPSHRDLLGSVMGLGLKRNRIGDIALGEDKAYLFAENAASQLILDGLCQANRTAIHVKRLDALPVIEPAKGREISDTVLSPRLDAIVSSAFQMSRAKAVELIQGGSVKLRHTPTIRPDARVDAGDAISVRGLGRARLDLIGSPTKKGRLPILITRFG